MFKTIVALPRTVWLIGLISLVNDGASEMLYPLIPLYLSSVLMAGPRALGIIEGIAEATASLLKLFSGVVVDRTRRGKPWIVFGYGLAGLGRPLIAFVGSWPWLLAIRFADRVGKGLRTSPRDALLAASVDAGQRGLVFGLHRAMDNTGAVIGPLLAALLLAAEVPLKDVFLWSVIPALVCLALAGWIREPDTGPAPQEPSPAFDWRLGDMPQEFKRYLAVVALFTLGNSSNMFLLLRASELGVPQAQIPLLWAAVSAVAALFSMPLSALSDRLGRVRLLVGGYIVYGLVYIGLGVTTHGGVTLLALFVFYGLFLAATEGVEKALVADLAPATRRGTAYGWFNLTSGAFLLPASVLFGWLYQVASPLAAFLFSAGCALLAAVLLGHWVGVGRGCTN
ncbi:MFS transporter [Dechloromonas agitata]|uniref:MFS transporter n=1 Tax=Dechloromonas agitata TaxID=73030 RepID=UPI00237DA197|nr:MFS transporter [Dechloromonas agitata]MDE1544085.1 MFS transporter [Dechloromonas agitata]